jgi:alkylation response protein AidB-like acyl-CoA dehydrogenase
VSEISCDIAQSKVPASSGTAETAMKGLLSFVRQEGDLPLPGSGHTWHRFEVLGDWAARDLSVGRLVEGHSDAKAILDEAGALRDVPPASTYGVWAARQPADGTVATPVEGGWRLSGTKPFCSGSVHLDRALVTADGPDGYRLFDISVSENVVARDDRSWAAVGMAASLSETLTFGGPLLPKEAAIGGPGFYTDRPGFWFGAAGVAACWYGGAVGLVECLRSALLDHANEHALADLGRATALVVSMRETLRWAAMAIDADPTDHRGGAHRRALAARQIVHDACLQVLSAVTSGGGARPLSHDSTQSQRAADLFVYLAQHHGNVDAAELGRIALGGLE